MNKKLNVLVLATALGSVAVIPSYAETQIVTVPYLTGGVGEGERTALQQNAKAGNYNLKVVTAAQRGNYIADAVVRVSDSRGNQVIQAQMDGPWLFLKLPPGRYQVAAVDSAHGAVKTREVQLKQGTQREVVFTWPRPELASEPQHVSRAAGR